MRFRAGPSFQSLAGIAEIEVCHDIGRVVLEIGFKGCTRFLILLLFQIFMTCANLLAPFIRECHGLLRVNIEAEHHDEREDLFHTRRGAGIIRIVLGRLQAKALLDSVHLLACDVHIGGVG
jgi:hypothetical protein